MQTFLQLVAHDLYTKIGSDLSRTALVFPNKRANLFFNPYLAAESDCPIWAPAAFSISDLFQKLSVLKAGDPIRLICELYKVFKEETLSEESLDDFYFWGELLISDFDDVDKNLVDANKLFSNLQDLKNIMDDYEFLDSEQEAAIQQFFQNFSIEKRTLLKDKFISLWDTLGAIYQRFRSNLTELGIAYEGMLYRNVIEHMNTDELKYDKYVFVGFNVLNKVEYQFFKKLQDAGKAMFYWDYDLFYTRSIDKHEAGEFLKRNLTDFPNELPESYFDVFKQPKTIHYLAASTENAQARFLPQWIRSTFASYHTDEEAPQNTKGKRENLSQATETEKLLSSIVNCDEEKEKENAVVLCNESMLLPVLHSIPQGVKNVNVTMGFPMAQTPVYSFIKAAMELQTTGYNKETGRFIYEAVIALLKHPYTRQLTNGKAQLLEKELTSQNRFYPLPSELQQGPFLTQLFTPQNGNQALCDYLLKLIKEISLIYRKEKKEAKEKTEIKERKGTHQQAETDDANESDLFNQLYQESLFQCHLKINRIYGLIESGELTVRTDTMKRLIDKILSSANIPFHGEPAIGLQIMGVLETRNLDFRNLVMLSLNEGQLPKASGESSFIPYNLRKAFGMTTIEHKNAVYAYYFYRLIQRAENITLLYNTSSDGLNQGEMSRFMLQLLIESPHAITREYLEAGQSPQSSKEIEIEKTPQVMDKLHRTYDCSYPKSSILSPSALNNYLDCRLRFYFRYVAKLRTPDEVSSDIDNALFGTMFHYAAELVYREFQEKKLLIQKEDIERLLHNEVKLQHYVDIAFKTHFFKIAEHEKAEYNGTQLINFKVILSYLKQLLHNDLQYAPFLMVDMERKVSEEVTVPHDTHPFTIRLGGTIDRLDSKDGTLRIVDYKTGGYPITPANIEQLFIPQEKRANYIFQTFLYSAIMLHQQPLKVAPALLYIHKAASANYSPVIEMGEPRKPKLPVEDFAPLEEEFRNHLSMLLKEIFDENETFTQTEDTDKCAYCDFKAICKR